MPSAIERSRQPSSQLDGIASNDDDDNADDDMAFGNSVSNENDDEHVMGMRPANKFMCSTLSGGVCVPTLSSNSRSNDSHGDVAATGKQRH